MKNQQIRLGLKTYTLDVLDLSKVLLGKYLCRMNEGKVVKYMITETEAYCGERDTACHAHKGKTNRTRVLYEQGGIVYVYLCYGMHYMLNVVSGTFNDPQAVLIRGIEGFDGPGKLTKKLKIDKSFNELNLVNSNVLWIEDHQYECEYEMLKRVGIDYATEEYKNKLWRFKLIKR